jgi:hypothetical protein
MASSKPDRLSMSHAQHDAFLKTRRDRIRFVVENQRAIISDKHMNEATAFIRQLTHIDITLRQTETMLELYPFVRVQVAKYGVYVDRRCRDEIANMVADFFLGSPWPDSSGTETGEEGDFLSLLRHQAETMGYGVRPL